MAWGRRRPGRKRKIEAKRYPSGGVVHEKIEPTAELTAKRRALFGNATVQAQTDWVIDQLWGAGALTDQARQAAQRFNALHRGRIMRLGAPKGAATVFRDAQGSVRGGWVLDDDDADTLDREYLAALLVLRQCGQAALNGVLRACCYDGVAHTAQLRVGLQALAQHFDRPQKRRLERLPVGGVLVVDDAEYGVGSVRLVDLPPVDTRGKAADSGNAF